MLWPHMTHLIWTEDEDNPVYWSPQNYAEYPHYVPPVYINIS